MKRVFDNGKPYRRYNLIIDTTSSCTPYDVRRIVYSVYCTVYTVQYTLYTIHYILYNKTLYTTHRTLHTIHYKLYSISCAVYMVRYSIYISATNATLINNNVYKYLSVTFLVMDS